MADNVGQARALSASMVARASLAVSSQRVALALLAVLFQRVAVEACLADLTVRSVGVVETLQATARLRIAVPRSTKVCVVVAVARLAAATGNFRIAEVIFCAALATGACVALETFADHIVGD